MIYESQCTKCGKKHEYIRPASQYLDTPMCCDQKTEKRIFSAPMGIVDIPAYQSPASGKWITSRSERREDFAATGTREWEGMANEKHNANRQKVYEEEKLDKKLDETVRKAWQNLPEEKKQLALAEA